MKLDAATLKSFARRMRANQRLAERNGENRNDRFDQGYYLGKKHAYSNAAESALLLAKQSATRKPRARKRNG